MDTLKVQTMETWPFYNSVTGDLTPLSSKKAAVKLQMYKILGFIPKKAPDDTAPGELEITYVDEELRITRGKGNLLFVLKMFDPTYRIPL
ncbi:PREDICTED: probable plastid-lipid-associated protein 5, chloroplastic [Camelina sativa]|uniref:Probable plastid-lipid-associated protein 5, chloroplastic n=1 Tax=Camelina sativa TaxID=90675 RepID=A0ABM1RM27_CAMSA|nr:PREDICTED: probable plastid-lipid-associated protein 5, chloroplastic [Camelina sativa]